MMKKILLTFSFSLVQILAYGQKTIDFEFSYPENSNFVIEQSTNTSGTMKITGSPQEIASLKKAGYNQIRKLKYVVDYSSVYKTGKKLTDSFPFEFYYSNVSYDIDSDGKKQKREGGFPNAIIKGNYIDGKPVVVQNSDVQAANDLPKYFLYNFPKITNMKVGDSFTTDRSMESKNGGASVSGILKYTLTKIEDNSALFSIAITQNSNKSSEINLKGSGTGEMVYNLKDKYIELEKMTINMTSSVAGTVKMNVDNTIISTYKLILK